MQKLQNRALRKINFKKFHHPIKHIYKDHNILKFADILKVQNCLFMYHKLNKIMHLLPPFLPTTPKTNTITRPGSATQNMLDVSLARTNKYEKESVKYHCVRDWNNFKKKFP